MLFLLGQTNNLSNYCAVKDVIPIDFVDRYMFLEKSHISCKNQEIHLKRIIVSS